MNHCHKGLCGATHKRQEMQCKGSLSRYQTKFIIDIMNGALSNFETYDVNRSCLWFRSSTFGLGLLAISLLQASHSCLAYFRIADIECLKLIMRDDSRQFDFWRGVLCDFSGLSTGLGVRRTGVTIRCADNNSWRRIRIGLRNWLLTQSYRASGSFGCFRKQAGEWREELSVTMSLAKNIFSRG